VSRPIGPSAIVVVVALVVYEGDDDREILPAVADDRWLSTSVDYSSFAADPLSLSLSLSLSALLPPISLRQRSLFLLSIAIHQIYMANNALLASFGGV